MKSLQSILQGSTYDVQGPTQIEIQDIVFDSRRVTPGALFIAIKGLHHNGHAFIAAAIQAGAKAVITEESLSVSGTTLIRVPDSLQALAHVSDKFWDHPSGKLRMIGITGTNGKTTTTFLIESIFQVAGWPTGVMGTINYRFGQESMPAPNTTPFASELQRFLASIVHKGGTSCVMEVSSHSLELNRVAGVDFDVAVFTNLTQDHLDFHKTMEAYADAKAKLFTSLYPTTSKSFPRHVVINKDDPWSSRMMASVNVPVLTYSLKGPADLYAKNIDCDATGSRFELVTPSGSCPVTLPLLGEYNVMNALAAAGAAISQQVPIKTIAKGLKSVPNVPGRVEHFKSPSGITVVVDYAHTDDALRQVMTALRRLQPKRLITVFGCGGDRDRTKRPLMGEAAARLSDEVIVTSDNPRSEDPSRITLDIEVGVRRVRSDHYEIILDREPAIAKSIAIAQPGDIVLIAGKGHENYQILGSKTIPFDDREVAQRLLRQTS